MQDKYIIDKIIKKSNYLEVVWQDSHVSKFHFLWLRDNCPSAFHKNTRMRNFNILTVPINIQPVKFENTEGKKLKIIWSENNHISSFECKMA